MISIDINGTLFDTTETIAVTLAASEIGKLETRQGSTTNQFTLPYTAELASALGFPDQLNISTVSPYRKIQAKLIDDNQILSFGYLQINEISEGKIRLTFYGNNSDWFSDIKDYKLTDIDLSDIDHTWSEANIIGSWNNVWTDGYIYPPIDYGRSFSLAGSQVEDWYPATFLRYIILRGFEQKGFKYDGDLFNDDLINKIIMPFAKKEFVNSDTIEVNEGTATRTQTIATASESKIAWDAVDDSTGGWDIVTNDRYDAPYDGTYDVVFNLPNVSGAVLAVTDIEIRVKINGILFETLVASSSNQQTTFNRSYALTSGDYIEWFCYHTFGSNITQTFGASVTYTNKLIEGGTVVMQYTVPEIEFADLLRWVGFTFGVVYTYDPYTKTVTFNKFQNIKDNTQYDWTEKLIKVNRYDFNEAINKYSSANKAEYIHTDDDLLLLTYKSNTGFAFGDGVITTDNEFNTEEQVIYTAPFAGTVTVNSPSGGYIPYIQRYSDRNSSYLDSDLDPKPRVLVLHADDGLNFTVYGSIAVGSTSGETSCAYATFFKTDHSSATIDGYNRSLAYATPQVADPNDTPIFESEYWDKYLSILANPRIIEAEMFLSKADIATIDFTRPVYIESLSALFYINKIKDYTGEGTTSVELVKL